MRIPADAGDPGDYPATAVPRIVGGMETTPDTQPAHVLTRRANLPVFLAVAFGTSWLVALPLWLSGDGVKSPILGLTGLAMMFTPSLGVVATWLVARRHGVTLKDLARETGLGLGPRKRRTFAVVGALWVGIPLFVLASGLVSAAVGLYRLDLTGLTLFEEQLQATGNKSGMSAQTLAVITLVLVPLSPAVNLVPSLGEEWGWRGLLMPRLLTYGRVTAIAVSGAIWGLWHAPLTLLGYNYTNLGAWAALLFVPFCMLFGGVLSWSRLVTGSVWPAAIGHGALNGSAGLVVLIGAGGQELNLALVGPIGLVGMAMLVVVVALLFRRGTGNVGFRPGSTALGEG